MIASHIAPLTQQTSVWSRLRSKDITRYVGIDIGVDQVHVAVLGRPGSNEGGTGSGIQWLSRARFQMPVDPFSPPAPDLVDTVCESLREKLPRCVDGERQLAAIALPLPWIHYETSPLTELKSGQANCQTMFGGSVFRSPAHVSNWPICEGKPEQVIAATAEQAACRVAQTISRLGYRVQCILPHGDALIRAAEPMAAVKPKCVVLLHRYGGLIATENYGRCGLCRSLPDCHLPEGLPEDAARVETWLEVIAAEIEATLRYVERLRGPAKHGGPVLVCGEMATIPGIDELLATMLDDPVAVWRYSIRLRPRGISDASSDVTRVDPARAVALSLAHAAAVSVGESETS